VFKVVRQSTKVKDKFRDRFSTTKSVQQETTKVKELKEKIKELENSSLLTETSTGKFLVALDKIEPSKQCRQTFTESVIQKRMQSLSREGQLDPLVLVPLSETEAFSDRKYQIEDGEVTFRAAKRLIEQGDTQWEYLEAVLSNIEDLDTIHFRTLLHHLHSEGLNPLDRAESIFAEINLQLQIETEIAVKLLRNIVYRSSRDLALAEAIANCYLEERHQEYLKQHLETDQIKLITLFNRLQVELGSFVKNDLAMLALTKNLKTAIRKRELPCHQAKIINTLSSKTLATNEDEIEQIRNEVLEHVLINQLSVGKTREYVSGIIEANGKKKSISSDKVKQNYQQIKTGLQKLPISQLNKAQLTALKSIMLKQLSAVDRELTDD
jgi:ParB family transcriptional regulator, chromosome partitioning protein